MIKNLKLTKRKKLLAAVIICVALITGSTMLLQMGQVAEAAILTPYNFYDDFSGDLNQWTVIRGTWAIENEELSQNSATGTPTILAGSSSWKNYVYEGKIWLDGTLTYGLIFRVQNGLNFYLFDIYEQGDVCRLFKCVGGVYSALAPFVATPINLNTWYTLKVEVEDEGTGVRITAYLDGVQKFNVLEDPSTFNDGKIGFRGDGIHAHFDDVKVTGAEGPDSPSTYGVNIRAGVTQIFVTCTWSGSGNIAIELVSPTVTYYESDMSIYEKSTVSFNGTTTSTFNIKRAALSISALSSSEVWMLYLDLSDVFTYQVSLETS